MNTTPLLPRCCEQSVKNVSTGKAVVHHRGNSSQYSVAFASIGCLKLHRQHFATKSNDTCSDTVNYRILRCTRIPAVTHKRLDNPAHLALHSSSAKVHRFFDKVVDTD